MSDTHDGGEDDALRADGDAPTQAAATTTEHDDDDWESRELCPDEACIGTLDEHGRCGVCGAQGEVPQRTPSRGAPASTLETLASTASPAALEPLDDDDESASSDGDDGDDEWEARELCPDETCIGTLGADGRCGVCGRRA